MDDPATISSSAIREAMETLGVSPECDWSQVRQAYREQVRASHPDVARHATATQRTATLNVAFQILRAATDDGRLALPAEPPPVPAPVTSGELVVLRAAPGDVFVQLLDASHRIGDVSYVDPEAGLIQVLLQEGGPAAAQLLIAVDQTTDPPIASFTLDTMGVNHVRPIHDVVADLGALLRWH